MQHASEHLANAHRRVRLNGGTTCSLAILPTLQVIALIALSLGAAYLPASGPAFTALITLAILFGGLPHGAFDIHIAAQRCAMRWREICIYLGVYLGLFFAMAALWFASAELALVLFFAISILHFSEDWSEFPTLQGWSLGASPLCVLAVSHEASIEPILESMASPLAAQIVGGALQWAALPVLSIAGVTLLRRIIRKHDQRAAAFALLLLSLPLLPLLVGFFAFFCVFHSPRHLIETSFELEDLPIGLLISWGVGLSFLAMALSVALPSSTFDDGAERVVGAFQLLAGLLVPHHFAPRIFSVMSSRIAPVH